MKKHHEIFNEIRKFLRNNYGDLLEEHEEGGHLVIKDSGIWIESDEMELTVGYNLIHQHFNLEYENLEMAIERFFELLTRRKKITKCFKGKFSYSHKIELEKQNGEFENLGTVSTWFYPFWKKTTREIQIVEGLIPFAELKSEYNRIKTMHNNLYI